MADFNKFIPFVLRWAAGEKQKEGESVEQYFTRSKKTGWSDDPLDHGGPTQCDVTLKTYTAYCRKKGLPLPTKAQLRNIPFDQWREILKESFWDLWQADHIVWQPIAEILVDWVWASGPKAIRLAQPIIGVTADGIVGPKTLAAVNGANPTALLTRLRNARIQYVENKVKREPSQKKWLKGWINRINAIGHEE